MKKAVLIFIVAAIVILAIVMSVIDSPILAGHKSALSLGIIILLVVFAMFFGVKRLTSTKRGEPAEDELSKKIMTRASSIAFYVSIYLWLFIMYFSDKAKLETHTLIGTGITGMALVFAICWVIIYFRGIRNE
jgi:hypothetical protein